jgi:protein TonB
VSLDSTPETASTARRTEVTLPAAKSWAEYRRRAALRIVERHPTVTYTGPVKEPLLSIAVLEVELKSDGQVARIRVARSPDHDQDTVQIAIDAVQRAAPYGEVRKLPRPWTFLETFLFNEDRRFKPSSLDD